MVGDRFSGRLKSLTPLNRVGFDEEFYRLGFVLTNSLRLDGQIKEITALD